ncbi:MAG: thymidine phosphorylase [Alphaproteobacteria bacterium]|nr:thymidine phosphorylase [Alphaproteobacteria bacterium]
MFPQEIIRKKRNGEKLSSQEISFFVKGITDGSIADAQTAALTMAIFLNGFSKEETVDLTLSMRDSGDVLNWDLNGPVIDKHSSGGVGDKVSLMLAPVLAACGGFVPMISGRGLGHTGGTLDKFDSIKGYNTLPSNELFVKTVKEVGCAIIGQTGNLAPADKKIYAIRDVCATVESINLITASILSKKLAAGLDHLVMDLKCGNGAFMDNIDNAKALARSIVDVANGAGTKTTALVTNMSEVLGFTVGNALEVKEAVDYLKNQNVNTRLDIVTKELCAELLVSCGLYKTKDDANTKICKVLSSGEALEKFARMVYMLGGPIDFVEKPEAYMPKAHIVRPVFADKQGYVASMHTRDIGMLIVGLKGGRVHPEQQLDYATGFSGFCQVGDYVDEKTPLAYIHAQTEDDYQKTADELKKLIAVEKTFESKPVILDLVK